MLLIKSLYFLFAANFLQKTNLCSPNIIFLIQLFFLLTHVSLFILLLSNRMLFIELIAKGFLPLSMILIVIMSYLALIILFLVSADYLFHSHAIFSASVCAIIQNRLVWQLRHCIQSSLVFLLKSRSALLYACYVIFIYLSVSKTSIFGFFLWICACCMLFRALKFATAKFLCPRNFCNVALCRASRTC